MSFRNPPVNRVRIHKDEQDLKIVIPAYNSYVDLIRLIFATFAFILLSTWLTIDQVNYFLLGDAPDYGMIVFFIVYLLIDLGFIIHLLWVMYGLETIQLRGGLLVLRRSIFGLGLNQKYLLRHIKQVRAHHYKPGFFERNFEVGPEPYWSYSRYGTIQFTYQKQIIPFGLWLSSGEATQVMDELEKNAHFRSAQQIKNL